MEVLVTAVSERSDLFVQSMESLLANLDVRPSKFIVHEDVRPGTSPGDIEKWLSKCGISSQHRLQNPSRGMGPAMLWCFQQATQPIVFYTQEDWLFVRPTPALVAMHLMERYSLNHIRFNKRKTMRAKHEDTDHPWHKIEKIFPFPEVADAQQKLCVSDHWYTQASLWRVDKALPGLQATAEKHPQANAFVAAFNAWMNKAYGDPGREWSNQEHRHERLKTYIWGPVAEPAYIKHLGSARTTGPIVHKAGA